MLKKTGLLLVVSFIAVIMSCTGCCTKTTRRKPPKNQQTTEDPASDHSRPEHVAKSSGGDEIGIFEQRQLPEREKDRFTRELYRRFELSFEMFQKQNYDGALREVERVQLEIKDDPYLSMQTWYLTAMIYHRTGKSSRRDRSMRKMMEMMEAVQKDPRFRTSFEDGMLSQEVVDMAISSGEERYAEFAE